MPRSYLEAFADPDLGTAAGPRVWVHRPAVGEFQAAPVEPDRGGRHFNVADAPGQGGGAELDPLLAEVEERAAALVRARLLSRAPLAPAERDLLASFFALLGMRPSPRLAQLDEAEARRGYEELVRVLGGMGWVFWEAEPPDYFVSSSAPFHVAFPADDGLVQGMELHAPGVEVTLPLTPRLALHATWKRRGELWRPASEDVLLELNARTMLRAHAFVVAPRPAIPG